MYANLMVQIEGHEAIEAAEVEVHSDGTVVIVRDVDHTDPDAPEQGEVLTSKVGTMPNITIRADW